MQKGLMASLLFNISSFELDNVDSSGLYIIMFNIKHDKY
jgi:hypothetical protein